MDIFLARIFSMSNTTCPHNILLKNQSGVPVSYKRYASWLDRKGILA